MRSRMLRATRTRSATTVPRVRFSTRTMAAAEVIGGSWQARGRGSASVFPDRGTDPPAAEADESSADWLVRQVDLEPVVLQVLAGVRAIGARDAGCDLRPDEAVDVRADEALVVRLAAEVEAFAAGLVCRVAAVLWLSMTPSTLKDAKPMMWNTALLPFGFFAGRNRQSSQIGMVMISPSQLSQTSLTDESR